ncbi:MAG: DUF3995 domain-containing protein [Leadbetterella sp.]|nr:DUF3995 domain-containing protein [Leadbetterella sp.]
MIPVIAISLILIFSFLSALHVYWALGGKWGTSAVIPAKDNHTKVIMPGAIATFIVAFGLLFFGAVVFLNSFDTNTSHIPGIGLIHRYGLGAIAGIFILRAIGDFNYVGFFKKIKTTRFARNDSRYYSPLCLIIGILAILLELNK